MIKFDWNLLFGLIDIIVFYLIMRKFLFGRIKKVMEARQALIASRLEESEQKNREADEKLQAYEDRLRDCEAEGKRMLNDARARADAEYNRIIGEAHAEAQEMEQAAKVRADAAYEKAVRESREDLAALAMQAAEKVVGEAAGDRNDRAIFDEFLNEGNHE